MKRLVLLIILLATPFLLFAESTERIITGIKKAADIPKPFAVVNVFGSEREAIMEDSRIIISNVMRNKSYNAFTWSFTGNCFRSVKLKYTFSPLTCNPNLADALEEEIIPYSVTVSHEATTADGKTITAEALPAESRIEDDFGGGYYYRLAESLTYNNSSSPVTLNVSGTLSQTLTLDYNFSTNSIVEQKNGNNYNDISSSYNKKVCCLWTRTGVAAFVLKVSDDGFSIPESGEERFQFTGGEYTCTVSVEIINES